MKSTIIPVTKFAQNSTVLWCTETMKGAVSDPGGDLDKILSVVDTEGIELEKILVTHGHLDHAGAVGELSEKFSLPIEGPHRDDQFLIDALPRQADQYGFDAAQSFTPDRWLEDGDTVTVGNTTLLVRHCPGHTPGHIIFFSDTDKLAIVGDVLFRGSIGRTDLPRGSYNQLVESISTRLWPLGEDVTFVPGHGDTSTFGLERKWNAFVSDIALGVDPD